MSKPTLLMLPFPAQGHVNPLMSFSLKLAKHGFNIIFVNTDFDHKRVVSSMAHQESIKGSPIKLVSIPDGLGPENDRINIGELMASMLSTMPAMLEKLIEDIHLNGDHKVSYIIVDGIMGWALEVASKMGINGAVFWPASAAMLALQYNIPMLVDDGIIDSDGVPFKKTTFQISPGIPKMDTNIIWWSNMLDPNFERKIFNYVLHCMRALNLAEWWVGNTAYELEPGALSFVSKLLPIGPLLRTYDNTSESTTSLGQFWEEDFSCMSWLDQQPHGSVLYVAFGSFTLFDQTHFTELALGLELTNRPFLWVVRQDSYNSTNSKMTFPKEFLGSKCKIVRWAPQQKVLSHPAIACFVSHCGWNSTLEGLSNAVPFLCWPYFADQFYNEKYICDELKVGLGFDKDENGVVLRHEIKKKVDQLLSDENIRSRSIKLKEKLLNDLDEGGRSSHNFGRFVKCLKH